MKKMIMFHHHKKYVKELKEENKKLKKNIK